jgi:hypothetical protein
MTATNHAITGALIGLTVHNPTLAIPLAFLSHFALDALPHYGYRGDERQFYKNNMFAVMLSVDAAMCGLLVLVLFVASPVNVYLAIVCAFIATSPDFMWVGRYIAVLKGKAFPVYKNPLVKFHSWIQWSQTPIGAIVEILWFFVFGSILLSRI